MLSSMIRRTMNLALATAAVVGLAAWPSVNAQTRKPAPPKSLRLYVLDCGKITVANGDSMGFKPGELATSNMVTPCFLIVHPRGTMMWDTGEIPDSAFKSGVAPQTAGAFTVDRPLLPQLAAIGYTPADITYLALSHYHGDHVANANAFAGSTWIVQKGDRDAIFAARATRKRNWEASATRPTSPIWPKAKPCCSTARITTCSATARWSSSSRPATRRATSRCS